MDLMALVIYKGVARRVLLPISSEELSERFGYEGQEIEVTFDSIEGLPDLDCALYPEIHNDLQLGMYLVKENGFNLALFLKYLDYEKYGHDVRLEEGGSFTDRGYFLPKADRL